MTIQSKFRKLIFPLVGAGSLLWFLLRVIPKPSRAAYPCMRVAYPIASAFVTYLIGITVSIFAFHKMKIYQKQSKYFVSMVLFIIAIVSGFVVFQADSPPVFADSSYLDIPNEPIGTGKGIHPGRVVWFYNPDATNEVCRNNQMRDVFHLPENTDIAVVEEMVTNSILNLTNETTVYEAWDALFKSFNIKKNKGALGYQSGEKIFIKPNLVGSTVVSSSNHDIVSLDSYTCAQVTPQPVLAILRQLINEYGIDQDNISVGDPQRDIQNAYWDIWHTEFPNVHYICHKGGEGRVKADKGSEPSIFYSDKGAILRQGTWSDNSWGNPIYQDTLYTVIEEADYLINFGALKVHERAGITILGKNHFGSHVRRNAKHLHMGLVNPDGFSPQGNHNARFGYGKYRVLVDLLGHEKLGGKTILYMIDGLWGSTGAGTKPVKFKNSPYNNDWPSSILISQDPVALESVCYDILKDEFTIDNHAETYPQMEGVDDHLHQAADASNWPDGIVYDPENDGTPIASLGVHEHWNDCDNKEYSRNMGEDTGIELLYKDATNETQDETVLVNHVLDTPIMDGNIDDLCWQETDWQEIGQTWMPYKAFVLADDFTGRYKSVWNTGNNRLYFLVEIKDDVLVDGYVVNQGGYYKYDVLELFVDEDHSGGLHTESMGAQNSENAFAYHVNADFPGEGNVIYEMAAMDGYEANQIANYANHFPDFALKQYSYKNVYEFSLQLYSDDFDIDYPEASLVDLTVDKMIGFSMAYCDNDDPDENSKIRDNFFGSVEVAHQDSNNHWINADLFGTMKLVDLNNTVAVDQENMIQNLDNFVLNQNYPNPFNPNTVISYQLSVISDVQLDVYNSAGQHVSNLVFGKQDEGFYQIQFDGSKLPSGIYVCRLIANNFVVKKKMLLLK